MGIKVLTYKHIHIKFARCSNNKRMGVIWVPKRDQILMYADIAIDFSSKPYLPFHSTCTCVCVHVSICSYKSKVIFLRGKVIRSSKGTEDAGGITFKSCWVQDTKSTVVWMPSQLTLFCFSKHSGPRLYSKEHCVLDNSELLKFPACFSRKSEKPLAVN